MYRWLATLVLLLGVACSQSSPSVWSFRIINSFPHDTTAFTQGLVFHQGVFYEGTGLNGRSELRKVEISTGRVLQRRALAAQHFGEGIALFGNRIFQLTWRTNTAFVYDLESFNLLRTFTYDTEGWGLTHDGKSLIMSDGTSTLYFRNPNTFAIERQVTVTASGRPVARLNELEYIEGKVWANVWLTNQIVVIEPRTGVVEAILDLTNLANLITGADVLNGIAYDPATRRLFVTGKLWPLVFEIAVVR